MPFLNPSPTDINNLKQKLSDDLYIVSDAEANAVILHVLAQTTVTDLATARTYIDANHAAIQQLTVSVATGAQSTGTVSQARQQAQQQVAQVPLSFPNDPVGTRFPRTSWTAATTGGRTYNNVALSGSTGTINITINIRASAYAHVHTSQVANFETHVHDGVRNYATDNPLAGNLASQASTTLGRIRWGLDVDLISYRSHRSQIRFTFNWNSGTQTLDVFHAEPADTDGAPSYR